MIVSLVVEMDRLFGRRLGLFKGYPPSPVPDRWPTAAKQVSLYLDRETEAKPWGLDKALDDPLA